MKIQADITVIVVGKRHHVRLFPVDSRDPKQADRKSGNCKAGTIVDREIVHPTDVDFYLLPHGGLLGTSRPGRYTLLHDDSNFTYVLHFGSLPPRGADTFLPQGRRHPGALLHALPRLRTQHAVRLSPCAGLLYVRIPALQHRP